MKKGTKSSRLCAFVANPVESKGFEPMTSALSKQRSKPTELRFQLCLRI